jgi:anti-sigma B factor antagonist
MHEGHKLHEARIAAPPGAAPAEIGIDPAGAFVIEPVDTPDGVAIVALGGELDMAATPEMRRHVDAAAGGRGLVLDLAETTFIDSAVLKELLRAHAELARYETPVVLVRVPPAVERLLELTRTAELFTIAPDRESALRRLGAS